jgi:nucleoside 2-deoxyribosyltransferase
MKLYLAGRFSRLPELNEYRLQLQVEGIDVTSRWLLGGHEWVGTPDEEIPLERLASFAQNDLDDINASDLIVCFTEPARSGPARGGRHFEAGYAYALGKPILVVGDVENIFYALPSIMHCPTWLDAFHFLVNQCLSEVQS